ncbi:hypothetical protein [Pseudoclavibacter sp. CFCC 13611]|uniref:hypothetical protein n=1 Tax=Pseudoclavibacter sp. CFCC 13611 TaxID=2615178 RepID=UPI0013018B8B|nr:hypothetical protein [Pseudoclavibacter sp. CFCC 13611]KAB1662762.1 hypothetical protein F8O08_09325 [Pseudoclavibacter sp. CFCC 13611]
MSDLFADVGRMLFDPHTQPGSVGLRQDGCGLFYAGAVNVLEGRAEVGWLISAVVAAQMLETGGSVLVVDVDGNDPWPLLDVLDGLGVSTAALCSRDRFRFAQPADRGELLRVVEDAGSWHPSVVLVGSLGSMPGLMGGSPQDGWSESLRLVLEAFAGTGAAVIGLDVCDGDEPAVFGRGGLGASVSGSRLRAEQMSGHRAMLRVRADRRGAVRAMGAKVGEWCVAAVFESQTDAGGRTGRFVPVSNGDGVMLTPANAVKTISPRIGYQHIIRAANEVLDGQLTDTGAPIANAIAKRALELQEAN